MCTLRTRSVLILICMNWTTVQESWVFNLFPGQQYLYPDMVKLWLGKPQHEYMNEAEGGCDMIYIYGPNTLSFHYLDEYEEIYLIRIYK
ncbi:hypothetical protein QF041_004775 [Paenibacillus sp. W2I17]|nr:hypothetical protein [Paenibacillus sp. W2I17]